MKRDKIILIAMIIPFTVAIFWFILSSDLKGVIQSDSKPVSHHLLTELLDGNVNENGLVQYQGISEKKDKLDQYLLLLSSNHPNPNWTIPEQKAYWINAYNAFTIRLILNNYPVESIKDLGGFIYRVNTAWDIEFITIEGQKYDLNDIEHNILRKNYPDPRIHFVLNCASKSCPVLSDETYESTSLEEQLDRAGRLFINNNSKNIITKDNIKISRIFKWFKRDFMKEGDLIAFINKFSNIEIDEDAEINYLEYDWRLNDF